MSLIDRIKKIGSSKDKRSPNKIGNSNQKQKIGENRDFKYLNNLIHSGQKEIVFDSDFRLKRGEKVIEINKDGLIIDGNNHIIDAKSKSSVFLINGNNVTLKNIIFKNSKGNDYGAIKNNGSLKIENCIFKDNKTSYKGGAIYNLGNLRIESTEFEGNRANFMGGSIFNYSGSLNLYHCGFKNNKSKNGGSIFNNKGLVYCFKCAFENNSCGTGFGGAIMNTDRLEINQSEFINNTSEKALDIYQDASDSSTLIENTTFSYQDSPKMKFSQHARLKFKTGSIHIRSGTTNINSTIFDSSSINREFFYIFNEYGHIGAKKLTFIGSDLNKAYSKGGSFKYYNDESQETKEDISGFCYLDNLIQNNHNQVSFDRDIILEESEEPFYSGGIEISHDNLTIDGKGHIISGNNLSRIFFITGKNIILKNIKLTNGVYQNFYLDDESCGGGAVLIIPGASVKFINCDFINNSSRLSGGAINNKGEISEIINNKFYSNISFGDGGAIMNNGVINLIQDSAFEKNNAQHLSDRPKMDIIKGGAIYNFNSFISFKDCKFNNNLSEVDGGGIYSDENGELSVENCHFENNSARYGSGGAICTHSDLRLYNSSFNNNLSGFSDPSIKYYGKIEITETNFKFNTCEKTETSDSFDGWINYFSNS